MKFPLVSVKSGVMTCLLENEAKKRNPIVTRVNYLHSHTGIRFHVAVLDYRKIVGRLEASYPSSRPSW